MLDDTGQVNLIEWAESIKSRAELFPARRSDSELYVLLSDCMSLAARVAHDEQAKEALKARTIADDLARGAKRSYFERDADEFLIVGRFMFGGVKARAACWRYTSCMREASKMGVDADNLADWLSKNGGINSLFKRRKVSKRTRVTKIINLNTAIEIPKSRVVSIKIRDDGKGFYDVISVSQDSP